MLLKFHTWWFMHAWLHRYVACNRTKNYNNFVNYKVISQIYLIQLFNNLILIMNENGMFMPQLKLFKVILTYCCAKSIIPGRMERHQTHEREPNSQEGPYPDWKVNLLQYLTRDSLQNCDQRGLSIPSERSFLSSKSRKLQQLEKYWYFRTQFDVSCLIIL